MHHPWQYWYLSKLDSLIPQAKESTFRKKRLMKQEATCRAPSRLCHMAWKRASRTGLRCSLLSGRSFGNHCDGIPGVRLDHFWDGGGVRVGNLKGSVRTFGIGDLSTHCYRQI